MIMRPGKFIGKEKEISLLWDSGKVLIELVCDKDSGKLQFVVKQGEAITTCDSFPVNLGGKEPEQITPLDWLREGSQRGAIGFASLVTPVDNVDSLIESTRAFIHRYFDCDGQFEHIAAAYVLMTWVYEAFDAVPYLRFLGEPESGKSTGSIVIGNVCYRGIGSGGAQTSAPIFRMIEAVGGTLVIDEADFKDTQIGSDVTKILNTGYRKGFPVQRVDKDTGRVEFYDSFGPKIINGRKPFQDEAVETRCLTYRPISTTRKDIPLQLPAEFYEEAIEIRNKALAWRLATLDTMRVLDCRVEGLGARATQIILPLLSVVRQIQDEKLGEKYREQIIGFALGVRDDRKSAKQESNDADVIQAYVNLVAVGQTPVTCGAVAGEVGHDDGSLLPVDARGIGKRLRNLGFKTRHSRLGSVVSIEETRLKALMSSYGIDGPTCEGDDADDEAQVGVTGDDGR